MKKKTENTLMKMFSSNWKHYILNEKPYCLGEYEEEVKSAYIEDILEYMSSIQTKYKKQVWKLASLFEEIQNIARNDGCGWKVEVYEAAEGCCLEYLGKSYTSYEWEKWKNTRL